MAAPTAPRGEPATPGLKPAAPEDIAVIKKRFQAVNRDRLAQVEEALPPRHRLFLEVLPLLFHINHPLLPGFVTRDAPAGIAGYAPSEATLRAAAQLARSFDHKRTIPKRYDVEALFLIGSAGTIAYSRHSDFDIWLCHREDLTPEERSELLDKAERVSAWAAGRDLEVHFFPIVATTLRSGDIDALSDESSGTAQRHLLLDEFYRTSLLVAGRYPLWWLVPPGEERNYDAYATRLRDQRFVKPGETIDLGGIPEIPANEFFGATLWQLYKAMGSPYKSLLKILLLETYAAEFPDIQLLSHAYKAHIYAGQVARHQMDPYILLFDKVERYLDGQGDPKRLRLARHAFFHRVGHNLKLSAGEDWRRDYVSALTERWGWSDRERSASTPGGRDTRLEQALEERNLLMNALMRSYRFLSRFARGHGELAAISQHDMNILGRRLFAAFERKAGKIERITEGMTYDLQEPQLQVRRETTAGRSPWLLSRVVHSPADGQPLTKTLHRAFTLVEVLTWAHFNLIVQADSVVTVGDDSSGVDNLEVNAILSVLRRHFPQDEFTSPGLEQLSRPAHALAAALFVNVGVDPFHEYTRQGLHLTSEQSDPLNYSSRKLNLALTLDLMYVNNWGEAFVHRYAGPDGICECLGDYLTHWRVARQYGAEPGVICRCATRDRGASIEARLGNLFTELTGLLGRPGGEQGRQHLLQVGGAYFILELGTETVGQRRFESYRAVLDYLGRPGRPYSTPTFDSVALAGSPLAAVYGAYRPKTVTVCYLVRRERAQVYVLDEGGALFYDVQPFHREASLVRQFSRFFDAVEYRELAGTTLVDAASGHLPVRFLRLERGELGAYSARAVDLPETGDRHHYGELQAITERIGDRTEVTIYYDSMEFSTLDLGRDLFPSVARAIIARRHNQATYPIYLTDIDLSGVLEGEPARHRGRLRTVHYLRYKRRIEQQLNAALKAVGEERAAQPPG